MDLYEQGSASSAGQHAGSATGDQQVTNGHNQTPDAPVGVQDLSRVKGSGGAPTGDYSGDRTDLLALGRALCICM